MEKIRLTKEFNFEMAHALWNYDGACSNIHGHSYGLSVTIIGQVIQDKENPKNGMVADFGDLKKMVNNHIVKKFDHSLVITKEAYNEEFSLSAQMMDRLIVLDFQPSCENLLVYFASGLRNILPPNLELYSLKLRETGSSFAEWYADDNND